jgi:hypothetical protein
MASSTLHSPSTADDGMRPLRTPLARMLAHSHCQALGACGSTSSRRIAAYSLRVCSLAWSGSSQAAVTEASITKAVIRRALRRATRAHPDLAGWWRAAHRSAQFPGNLLVGDDRFAPHRQHAHHFLAVARDAHFLALFDQVDQGREVVLGFRDAEGLHLGQKN